MAWHRNIVATRTVMIGGVMLLAGLLVATGHLGSAAIAEEKGKAENQSTIKQCDDAKQRSHRGEWENAKSKYEEILKAFPTSDCASAGLKALLETKNRCDIGAALKKAKLWDEAKKQYDAAFVNSPTSE